MKVYMDMNKNEIVSEDVARSRMRASVDGDDLMNHIFNNVSWGELIKHIDHDFVMELVDRLSDDWFDERFEEYDLIESE